MSRNPVSWTPDVLKSAVRLYEGTTPGAPVGVPSVFFFFFFFFFFFQAVRWARPRLPEVASCNCCPCGPDLRPSV